MSNKKLKPENIKGTYVENPTCSMCGARLKHEWLAGDYSMLICKDEKCWDKWGAQRLEIQQSFRLQTAAKEATKFLTGLKR